MKISEAIARVVKARWRDGLINILIDVGLTLGGNGPKGQWACISKYQYRAAAFGSSPKPGGVPSRGRAGKDYRRS